MRRRMLSMAAVFILAAGCGGPAPDTSPATPEDEKAAEQRIKEEAARELKSRQQNREKANQSADDRD
jgi:hypothetical protein